MNTFPFVLSQIYYMLPWETWRLISTIMKSVECDMGWTGRVSTCKQSGYLRGHMCCVFHHIHPSPLCTRKTRCYVNGIPRRRLHSGMTSLNPAYKKKTNKKNTFLPHVPSLKKTYSYSVSSSTITCLSIANQSRAANPNRQSSKVASKNTSLALSQLQPIREGTYVAKLHRAPRGYGNEQDLPHDLPSFFLSCKPCWCDKPCVEKHRDTGSPCASESLLSEGLSNAFLTTNSLW